ncbi:STAS domain-containing protein [Kitasatospora sp. NPDC004240]
MTGYLALEVSRTPDVAILTPQGDIDTDNADRLHAAVRHLLTTYPVPPLIVIDLHLVCFCDSAALNTLLRARADAQRQGTRLYLARPTSQVARLLEVTGADGVFTVVAGVPAVLSGDPAGGVRAPRPPLRGRPARCCGRARAAGGRRGPPRR